MDYLCELPNDAARRKALDPLPPDLNSTYERILNRVNQSNPDTRRLVRRALRWIASDRQLTTKALCEAVSIDFGDTRRNVQAIPDEFEVLHWCSSLVRKSADDIWLELAHFTVKEFLQQIDPLQYDSNGAYRLDPPTDEVILAKVCLTYLNFEDFDKSGLYSHTFILERSNEYHFRHDAVEGWTDAAQHCSADDDLFPLVQRLFSPSKPNRFITWVYDKLDWEFKFLEDSDRDNIIISICAESTPLHWAAVFGLTAVARWLITSGCDVNRNSPIGTALHCALCGLQILELRSSGLGINIDMFWYEHTDFVSLLLKHGANPNIPFDSLTGELSTLVIALSYGNLDSVPQLIDMGGVLDTHCLDLFEEMLDYGDSESIREIMNHAKNFNAPPKERGRLLQLATISEASIATRLMQQDTDSPYQKGHYEQMLRTAAEFGQLEIIRVLLDDKKISVDVTDDGTGMTALHHAVETDQLEVVQVLIDHGADSDKMDNQGRTALHYSVLGKKVRCLEFLLQQDANPALRDAEGMTVWHLAAEEGNIQALRVLLSRPIAPNSFETHDEGTPLLSASASESKAAVDMVPSAGCSLTETASDGSSLVHFAVLSGSLEVIEFLFEQKVDPLTVTHDGSSAIHHAIEGNGQDLTNIVRILLEHGVDPSKACNNGGTPLDVILRKIREEARDPYSLDRLFATGLILSRSSLGGSRLASDMRPASELLCLACSMDFPSADQIVSGLLELGLDLNACIEHDQTALMAAASNGYATRLDSLLVRGADPCVGNKFGLNALHFACSNDQRNIVARLRETAIDWNSKAATKLLGGHCEMVTPLHIAASSKYGTVVEYLLGGDLVLNINACNSLGQTPLIIAVYARSPMNVYFLLANNADATIIDVSGNSAIHRAAQLGLEDVITKFMEYGSDLGLPNKHGLTPELMARKYGHNNLAKIIWNYVGEESEFYCFSSCAGAYTYIYTSSEDDLTATPHSQKLRKSHGASEALKLAIDSGDLELCIRLVEDGMDLASGFDRCLGCRPLLYSFQRGKLAITKYLLAQGASTAGSTCKSWRTRGFTVFHYAAVMGSAELLSLLLEKAPNEIYAKSNPIHSLHVAVFNGNSECVKLILDHANLGKSSFRYQNLQWANRNVNLGKGRKAADQLGTVREGLDWIVGMQVRRDMFRWSWYGNPREWFPKSLETAKPLHIAAYKGYVQILRMLLAYGAHVDDEDDYLPTPLHYAAYKGHMESTLLLLDAGANPNALDMYLYSPCMTAILYNQIDALELLLKRGADIQLRSRDDESALFIAAKKGAKDCFLSLMTRHDLWTENMFGQSILSSILTGPSSISMSFVVNVPPIAGAYESRLSDIQNIAIKYRSTTEVKMLLRRLSKCLLPGFTNNRCPGLGTPLNAAATLSKIEVITLLLDAGAQLELEGSEHGTPLMAACATGRLAAVKVLVAKGAKTSYTKDGQTYSAFAAAEHYPLVRRWLLVGRFTAGPKLLTCGQINESVPEESLFFGNSV